MFFRETQKPTGTKPCTQLCLRTFLHSRALLWKSLFRVSTWKYPSFEDTRAESFTLDVNLSLWRHQPFARSILRPLPLSFSGTAAFTTIRLTNHSSDRGIHSLWSFCINLYIILYCVYLHTTEQLLKREKPDKNKSELML